MDFFLNQGYFLSSQEDRRLLVQVPSVVRPRQRRGPVPAHSVAEPRRQAAGLRAPRHRWPLPGRKRELEGKPRLRPQRRSVCADRRPGLSLGWVPPGPSSGSRPGLTGGESHFPAARRSPRSELARPPLSPAVESESPVHVSSWDRFLSHRPVDVLSSLDHGPCLSDEFSRFLCGPASHSRHALDDEVADG